METGFDDSPIGLQARAIYEAGIKQKVEPEQFGKYLVIDVDTGDYNFDADNYAVVMRSLREKPIRAATALRSYRLSDGGPVSVNAARFARIRRVKVAVNTASL